MRPRRRRRIYGQFFLLIFITSTCERGSATKRRPLLPLPTVCLALNPSAFHPLSTAPARGVASVVPLSTLQVERHIFLTFSRSLSRRTTQITSGGGSQGILKGARGIDLCESRKDSKRSNVNNTKAKAGKFTYGTCTCVY